MCHILYKLEISVGVGKVPNSIVLTLGNLPKPLTSDNLGRLTFLFFNQVVFLAKEKRTSYTSEKDLLTDRKHNHQLEGKL